jgi:hypothetical protein
MPSTSSVPTKTPISAVPVSTVEVSLFSNMSSYYFDNNVNDYDEELKDILTAHLFRELRLSLPNKYRLMKFDMILMPLQNRKLRSRQLNSSRNFLLSGNLLFIGEIVPEIDTVDAIILQSFNGRALSLCLDILQSAQNAEIRSIANIEASMFKVAVPTKTISSESAVPKEPWYAWFTEKDNLLIVVIGLAGTCLLAGLATIAMAARKKRLREERARTRHRRGRDSYYAY